MSVASVQSRSRWPSSSSRFWSFWIEVDQNPTAGTGVGRSAAAEPLPRRGAVA
jgi:hypothetical protein